MDRDRQRVFRLAGRVQHYAWGGTQFLPALLECPNPDARPFAEYWMGAHNNASSIVLIPGTETDRCPPEFALDPKAVDYGSPGTIGACTAALNTMISSSPGEWLGAYTAARFGRLPYLLKILDVKDMLSIQVHPSKKDAEQAFRDENNKGIPLAAPDRNYKDDNHKPELMVALSDFWLLHGFKPAGPLRRILQQTPELRGLEIIFAGDNYQRLYKAVMEMEPLKVNAILQPLLDRIIPLYKEDKLSRDMEDFWAARAALTFNETGRIDRGIFSIYLFNLVNLHPGEAIFQDAGLPHAYLEGQNVEIMANSDNVLRGGLTPKHIDLPELLKHVRYEATTPQVITGEQITSAAPVGPASSAPVAPASSVALASSAPVASASPRASRAPALINPLAAPPVAVFRTPAPDFELSRIALSNGENLSMIASSAEIYFVLDGDVEIAGDPYPPFDRKTGNAFIAFDGARLDIRARKDSVLFRAAVQVPQ